MLLCRRTSLKRASNQNGLWNDAFEILHSRLLGFLSLSCCYAISNPPGASAIGSVNAFAVRCTVAAAGERSQSSKQGLRGFTPNLICEGGGQNGGAPTNTARRNEQGQSRRAMQKVAESNAGLVHAYKAPATVSRLGLALCSYYTYTRSC